jgi:hypothetical protein
MDDVGTAMGRPALNRRKIMTTPFTHIRFSSLAIAAVLTLALIAPLAQTAARAAGFSA